MHEIIINDQNHLIVNFEPTQNSDYDDFMEEVLIEFRFEKESNHFVLKETDHVKFQKTLEWVHKKFIDDFGEENVTTSDKVKQSILKVESQSKLFQNALINGREIKSKKEHVPILSSTFNRDLMPYQKESVEHMQILENAANFSVPGSGKTTITYAAISKWLEDNPKRKIFVIGPNPSFLSWEEEYEGCFGKSPRSLRISGEFSTEFHNLGDSYDIFLIHFNSAMNHIYEIQEFLKKWETVLIIDESHYIKSPQLKRWAATALSIAPFAKRRIILSGTPMPNSAKDLWTQFTFLWPQNYPLGNQILYNNYVNKNKGTGKHQSVLENLFCRIKKSDLNLPEPEWKNIEIDLNSKQQEIYDVIAAKTLKEIQETTLKDQAKLQKFRIAKMIRLLQTASNPSLLQEMSSNFDVSSSTFSSDFGIIKQRTSLPGFEKSIVEKISNYSKFEIPSKMVKASQLARNIIESGENEKVIIWNSFIHNMDIFKNQLLEDLNPIVINGTTPTKLSESGNRDELIKKFRNDPDCKILITSAASMGESVSLHKTKINGKDETVCKNAIYLDRNFNGAQYMQSMDRIHRIGMKDVTVKYYILTAKKTIDVAINRRLNEKWENMLDVLNDDMLLKLNSNPDPEELDNEEFNMDYQAVVDHLRMHY